MKTSIKILLSATAMLMFVACDLGFPVWSDFPEKKFNSYVPYKIGDELLFAADHTIKLKISNMWARSEKCGHGSKCFGQESFDVMVMFESEGKFFGEYSISVNTWYVENKTLEFSFRSYMRYISSGISSCGSCDYTYPRSEVNEVISDEIVLHSDADEGHQVEFVIRSGIGLSVIIVDDVRYELVI